MLTEEEIIEAEKQSKKIEVVKKLLDFYNDCQADGIKAFGISLNKKLLVLSQQIDDADIDISNVEDRVFDRIFKTMTEGGKIAENLKKIYSDTSSIIESKTNKIDKAHEGKPVV